MKLENSLNSTNLGARDRILGALAAGLPLVLRLEVGSTELEAIKILNHNSIIMQLTRVGDQPAERDRQTTKESISKLEQA